jgi:hypothetical protein
MHDVLRPWRLVDVAVGGLSLLQAVRGSVWAARLVTLAVKDVWHAVLLVSGAVESLPACGAETRIARAASWLDALLTRDVDHLRWLVNAAMRPLAFLDPKAGFELALRFLAALVEHNDHLGVLVYLAPRRPTSNESVYRPPPRATLDIAKLGPSGWLGHRFLDLI